KAVQDATDPFLVKKAAIKGLAAVREARKNFRKTAPYIHLTFDERLQLLRDIADLINRWDDCRLFGECIDKTTFGSRPPRIPPFEEAFEQVVVRFHKYLERISNHGLLVQD